MAKDTFYFPHDYNTRTDDKIKGIIRKHGVMGYGVFWCIIEDLYNNANALRLDYEGIAYDLRCDKSLVESIINDFGLFVFEDDFFGSLSVQRRLDERAEKSQKARDTANRRWNKDAKAMPTHCEGNAIKERKGKEIKESKEKDIEQRKLKFASSLSEFNSIYSNQMLDDFLDYWTEPTQGGKKMRFELQKTWSLELRLKTWKRNENKFSKTGETKIPILQAAENIAREQGLIF